MIKLLSLVELKSFLETEVGLPLEIMGFSEDSPQQASSFKMTGSTKVSKNIYSVDVSVVCRGEHPSISEQNIYKFYNKLNDKTDLKIGANSVIQIRPISLPSYLGEYENGLFYFTVVFTILTEVMTNE